MRHLLPPHLEHALLAVFALQLAQIGHLAGQQRAARSTPCPKRPAWRALPRPSGRTRRPSVQESTSCASLHASISEAVSPLACAEGAADRKVQLALPSRTEFSDAFILRSGTRVIEPVAAASGERSGPAVGTSGWPQRSSRRAACCGTSGMPPVGRASRPYPIGGRRQPRTAVPSPRSIDRAISRATAAW